LHAVTRVEYTYHLVIEGQISTAMNKRSGCKQARLQRTPSTPPTITREPSTLMQQQRKAAASFET
jgi:hypothetical protein